MASLTIKNETVYVIYRNGQPYSESGRKLVYTTKGAANGVITYDSEQEARRRYEEERRNSGYKKCEWWQLGNDIISWRIDEVKNEFEVVEYIPRRDKNERV